MIDHIEVRTAVLETKMEQVQQDTGEIKADVRAIRDTLSQAKGGWKTLMLIGGAAGAVGAVLGKFLPFVSLK